MILDILAEGRRKNIVHLLFEADATAIRAQIARHQAQSGETISLTSYISKVLADTVAAEPHMHAVLHSRRELIIFDDVDLSILIEREIEGTWLPVPYIVRAANQKTLAALDKELKLAKSAPLNASGPLSALETQFFALPRFARKIIWHFIRRDAHLFREVVGTVGVTSMGMHATGRTVAVPITPMTLTLCIGAIGSQAIIVDGLATERQVIQLNLSADHDIIDGVPLMRFAEALKQTLQCGGRIFDRQGD